MNLQTSSHHTLAAIQTRPLGALATGELTVGTREPGRASARVVSFAGVRACRAVRARLVMGAIVEICNKCVLMFHKS